MARSLLRQALGPDTVLCVPLVIAALLRLSSPLLTLQRNTRLWASPATAAYCMVVQLAITNLLDQSVCAQNTAAVYVHAPGGDRWASEAWSLFHMH